MTLRPSCPELQDRILVQDVSGHLGVFVTLDEYVEGTMDQAAFIALLTARPHYAVAEILDYAAVNRLDYYDFDKRKGAPPLRFDLPDVKPRVRFWLFYP